MCNLGLRQYIVRILFARTDRAFIDMDPAHWAVNVDSAFTVGSKSGLKCASPNMMFELKDVRGAHGALQKITDFGEIYTLDLTVVVPITHVGCERANSKAFPIQAAFGFGSLDVTDSDQSSSDRWSGLATALDSKFMLCDFRWGG